MSIRRVVPNIATACLEESRAFYTGVLGFEVGMDLGWIVTVVSPANSTAQLSLGRADAAPAPSFAPPHLTVEVTDVDEIHAKAVAQELPIVYPLTDEAWGVRRFFLVDPNGWVLNIMSHPAQDTPP